MPRYWSLAGALLLGVCLLPYFSSPAILSASAQSSYLGTGSGTVDLDQQAWHSVVEPAAERQLLDLLNSTRIQHRVPPLRMDRGLRRVARAHSHDMAVGGYVGHGSPSGGSAWDRLSHVVAWGLVAENVTFAVNCNAAHRVLVASKTHLENILEPRFHRVGIGVFSAGSLGLAVTQDFAE